MDRPIKVAALVALIAFFVVRDLMTALILGGVTLGAEYFL